MNRHVIKGRGENRGKYLCWARMGPEIKPTEDGLVWLPEQRKAARWDDPRYSGHTWGTDRARLHNGYFVKLVAAATLTAAYVDELKAYIADHAAGAPEELPCHWFGGDFHDAGEDYCRDCAEKLVDEKHAADPKRFEELYGDCEDEAERYRAAIDGGFDTDHDGPPHCETCGVKLSGNLTDCGADEEITALTGGCAPTFDDAEGWAALDHAITNLSDDDPRWRKIARVVEAAREKQRESEEAQAELSAALGMPEARASLLALLAARKVQQAPRPSYRLWNELRRYLALPFEERHRPTKRLAALERCLWKEAERMLACLGYRSRGDCFSAPYGEYYWLFVVQVEQHKLWQTPALVEGRAYITDPCPSGDPEWPHNRDANPYPAGTDEHVAWDCGYISLPDGGEDRAEA